MLARISIAAVLGVLILGASARADDYTTTALTAAQILEKSDAAYGTLADGTYTRVSRLQTGGVEYTRTTVLHGEDYRTTMTGGGFTSAYGYVDKQSWQQNENGILTLRSNFHANENPNDLALEHPDDPKWNVRVLGVTEDAPHDYVIEINPPGGFDQFRYYDASTFLLSKVVSYTRDRNRHVTEYADYRTAFGETAAYRVHSYDGRPQNDSTTTILSFSKIGTAADVAMPQGYALFGYTGKPVDLPVTFTRDGIVLHTIVNGRGLDFVLDSGASGMFIDPGVAHELGLTPYGRSTETIGGGDVDQGSVRIPDMKIGPLDIPQVVFTTTPFDEQIEGARAVGLIGFDFLASGIFEIDFKAQKVTLYPRDGFDPKALQLVGLPLQLDDGVPRTVASMEGVDGRFLLDTGAFNLMIYQNYANKLHGLSTNGETRIGTVGGGMSARVVGITDLIFGGVHYRAGQAIEPIRSTFDITDYDGVLGRDVLANYQTYFDYGDGMVYLKTNLK